VLARRHPITCQDRADKTKPKKQRVNDSGGMHCRAIARVVVMSILLLSAGSNNKVLCSFAIQLRVCKPLAEYRGGSNQVQAQICGFDGIRFFG
jgi:hypothetical protein